MELKDLLAASEDYLSRFNYDEYPLCFSAFSAAAEPALCALDPSAPDREAEALILALEQERLGLPRRQARQALDRDRKLLSLFLVPAARRTSPEAERFALALCQSWNRRYPRSPFQAGDYDAIMKGFDANLLGLPLRKSRRR